MKAEVKIWNERSKIILYPENVFEEDLLEKIKELDYQELKTEVIEDFNYYALTKRIIEIEISK